MLGDLDNFQLDLSFERIVDIPKELIWRAWTEPELIIQWFTHEPWKTTNCEIDLRPGGKFSTVVRSPEGQEFSNVDCYLEVHAHESPVWTNALSPGFVRQRRMTKTAEFSLPQRLPYQSMPTAQNTLQRLFTRMKQIAKIHSAMGFQECWGKALDQLVTLAKKIVNHLPNMKGRQ